MAELKIDVSEELEKELQLLIYTTVQNVFEESLKKDLYSRDYLSLPEVCEYVQISRGTLNTWISKYQLKTIKIGGRTFISKSTLIEFMNNFEN